MVGRLLFLSAAAFVAYKYIRRSNSKVQQEIADAPGTLEILPPETQPRASERGTAAEELKSGRTMPRLSAAAEDLTGR